MPNQAKCTVDAQCSEKGLEGHAMMLAKPATHRGRFQAALAQVLIAEWHGRVLSYFFEQGL